MVPLYLPQLPTQSWLIVVPLDRRGSGRSADQLVQTQEWVPVANFDSSAIAQVVHFLRPPGTFEND